MKKLNPIDRSKFINDEYKRYLTSTFKIDNDNLQSKLEKGIQKANLFNGPFLNLNLPFERGMNLNQLIEEGVISKSFEKLKGVDFERPLYAHQEEAIRHLGDGNSAIITTGTGSGKTECFLYPVLNEIMRDIENGNTENGVRAIFLYPMNALVNDQVDRLRNLLLDFPEIKYGFYTGNTPQKVNANERKKILKEENLFIPENELISREEIRKNPPHLLFTNYSMLEFLLIRPTDYSIIDKQNLKNWKYVVLDEAHTYSGSLGIELSLLMRRVTAFADVKPRFILTSATLGKKGESEEDIVKFANNLTATNSFSEKDIIFAKHIRLDANNIRYTVDPEDYIIIEQNIDEPDKVSDIFDKYGVVKSDNLNLKLYELLARDKNVYSLYMALKSKSRKVANLSEAFDCDISLDQLISLISLINMAEKEGIGIFDLKYHSFIKPLTGAYVTLGDEQKLSLKKTGEIDGLKAFEVGNCRFCNTMYIVGRIIKKEDGLSYLYQNDEVDIYENYGFNKRTKVDFFVFQETMEDGADEVNLEEYVLCAKCGSIRPKGNLNGIDCKCGEHFKKSVYKVIVNKEEYEYDTTDDKQNNIPVCVCCASKSKSGVVRLLNIGKDEGTAIVSQIMFEAIGKDETKKSEIRKDKKLTLSLKPRHIDNVIEEKNAKQILAFSDSRQQASVFAVYFENRNESILRRRLLWEVIKQNNYNEIEVDLLVSKLSEMIRDNNLFSNELSSEKNAWITVLRELLKVDGGFSGEGLGLFHFDLDLDYLVKELSDKDVEDEFGIYNINKKDLLTVIQVIMDVFKVSSAVNYVNAGLTAENKEEYLSYRSFDNSVCLQGSKSENNVRSLLPIKAESNKYTRYIEKVFGCDSDIAKEIIAAILELLINISNNIEEPLLKKKSGTFTYQSNVDKYILKNYKTTKYYRCEKCKRITPYNVHNVCPMDRCDGNLVEIDPDDVLEYNYYRRMYKTKTIEPLVVKEHTAQLDIKTAQKYQNDFKDKKINILSCSTTFEMGVDIGSLENVYMRNVPPTPANYVQRAGRAGRRRDSSAYILTYCNTNSHDLNYFLEPEKMISGVIKPPHFTVSNRKIILRHLMAISLGFFFRDNVKYYGNVDNFVFNGGFDKFNEYLFSRPKSLIEYIDTRVLPEKAYKEYWNLQWFDSINGCDEKLKFFVESVKRISAEYESAINEAQDRREFGLAKYYDVANKKLHSERIINELSNYCVIPKYGFPIDVVELFVYEDGRKKVEYRLQRDLRIAIYEYAPDCEVVVDGKKYTSKYIARPKAKSFVKHHYIKCKTCGKVNVFYTEQSECKYCGESFDGVHVDYYIVPEYGFITGETKKSKFVKPERSYAGNISYIGGGNKDSKVLKFGNMLSVETSSSDKLLVMNRNVFYMCPFCGYSIKGTFKPERDKVHMTHYGRKCSCKTLEKVSLGHAFETDVARFEIPALTISDETDYDRALSFLYAFLGGISLALDIERKDIDGIVEMNCSTNSYDVLIFDNVPGGAGHAKRLLNRDAIIRSLKLAKVRISRDCCDVETSCYNCLREYNNQQFHSKLRRSYALKAIDDVLNIEGIDSIVLSI